jgi:hypothetical protein
MPAPVPSVNESSDDRRGEDSLCEHHRTWSEQQPQVAERPRAGQDQIERQTDDDRRQTEQRVDHDDEAGAGRKTDRPQSWRRAATPAGSRALWRTS